MYDFCLTFPYAALLALGGLIGFLTKGSLPSLMGGLSSALILAVAGQRSLSHYQQASRIIPSPLADHDVYTQWWLYMAFHARSLL